MSNKHVHILAICGYSTSGLAIMAKKLGYFVTGSDEDAYPPNSSIITKNKIPWHNLHSEKNLGEWGTPDLVVQGNQIREGNVELEAAKKLRIRIISDSEFFYELTKNRERIAVCGSHGKTTTSALVVWILEKAGRSPGFRLGTIIKNFDTSVRLGLGKQFVFEGDEYTTTFSDVRPKFFHFHPKVAVINNIEWDHPDVYTTPAIYNELFKKYLVSKMPKNGLLVVNGEDKNVMTAAKNPPCPIVSFGLTAGDYRASSLEYSGGATKFKLTCKGKNLGTFTSKLSGVHNIKNSLAAIAVSLEMGVPLGKIKSALKTFKGTSRRFELVGKAEGVFIVDDYAHHPTKARETIAAARKSYPNSRIFAIFVPHTYSRTKALIADYAKSFLVADYVIIPDIEPARERHLAKLVHSRDLVAQIGRYQKNVFYIPEQKDVLNFVANRAKSGDVVLCMSVRGFDGLAKNMVNYLRGHNLR
jgi:UDP-N-acetylmuramate: L-alanyl-gamma-D-glutamyl-meso-diaminopimelate ligase